MTGKHGTLRGQRGKRIAAIMTAVAAMTGLAGTALASPRAPMPSASVTAARISEVPAGWAPVTWERARLSVPGSWLVETAQQLSCGIASADGMIFAGVKPAIPKAYGCGLTGSLAWILPAGKIPSGVTHRKPTAVINGIPVYRLPAATGSTAYLVPDLGVRVGARGKLAGRVLATLARSPLAVVLRRGPAAPVPGNWTWRQFGGVRFATPRAWTVQHEDQWATCGTGLWRSVLLLINAVKQPLALPCPFTIPTASANQAQPGLTVVTGKYASQSVGESYGQCRTQRGVRICLSAVTGQGGLLGGVLIFSVSRPHHVTTYFLLGLPGSGADARRVFGSVSAPK